MREMTPTEAAWAFCTHEDAGGPCDATPVACSDDYDTPGWSGAAWCQLHKPKLEPTPLLGVV